VRSMENELVIDYIHLASQLTVKILVAHSASLEMF
jgi:hypothetical protein